jgi:hypothetical protein
VNSRQDSEDIKTGRHAIVINDESSAGTVIETQQERKSCLEELFERKNKLANLKC